MGDNKRFGHTDNRGSVITVSVSNPYVRGKTVHDQADTHNRIQESIAQKTRVTGNYRANRKLVDSVYKATILAGDNLITQKYKNKKKKKTK